MSGLSAESKIGIGNIKCVHCVYSDIFSISFIKSTVLENCYDKIIVVLWIAKKQLSYHKKLNLMSFDFESQGHQTVEKWESLAVIAL